MQTRHDPVLCSSRYGCWAYCACGWRSEVYTTVSGAHLEFGGHLRVVNQEKDVLVYGRVLPDGDWVLFDRMPESAAKKFIATHQPITYKIEEVPND